MKELVAETGGRHCYGDEFVEAEMEVLTPLQQFFSQFGALIISGCAITANGGNWDIAAGVVGIPHADGYKVARFAGVTNVSLPGFLSIGKTTQTGNYGEPGSIVVKDISNTYTAAFTAGATVANDGTELVIPDAPGQPVTFVPSLKALSNTAQQTFAFNVTDAEGTIYIIMNKLARLAYIKGSILFKNIGSWPFEIREITLVPKATLVANAVIGTDIDAMGERFWQGVQLHNTGVLVADAGSNPINAVTIKLNGSGIVVEARKTSGTAYSVYFNAVVPMDL